MTTEDWEDWRCEIERMVRHEFPDRYIKVTRKRYNIHISGAMAYYVITATAAERLHHEDQLIPQLHMFFDVDRAWRAKSFHNKNFGTQTIACCNSKQ